MSTYLKKNEKKAKAKKQFFMIITAFVVIICLFLLFGSRMRSAQVQASGNRDVCYTSVRIQSGDTLWDIADTYMWDVCDDKNDYIDQIKEINHITEADLQAGSYIIVPCTQPVK